MPHEHSLPLEERGRPMTIPDFDVIRPLTLDEAAETLALRPGARALGGGTDLLVSIKQGLVAPPYLVDLSGVPEMRRLEEANGTILLGGSVTLAEIIGFLDGDDRAAAVREAALAVASPVLRNMATLAGNVCLEPRCIFYNRDRDWRARQGYCLRHQGSICQAAPAGNRCYAAFLADVPVALSALGATVDICRWDEGRTLLGICPIDALYTGNGARHLALVRNEFVLSVRIPVARQLVSGYEKLRWRSAVDFPTAGVAVAFRLSGGVIRDAKVVVGGVDAAPFVARKAAALLEGRAPGTEVFTQAADVLLRGARMVNNHAAGAAYRRSVAKTVFRRLGEKVCTAA